MYMSLLPCIIITKSPEWLQQLTLPVPYPCQQCCSSIPYPCLHCCSSTLSMPALLQQYAIHACIATAVPYPCVLSCSLICLQSIAVLHSWLPVLQCCSPASRVLHCSLDTVIISFISFTSQLKLETIYIYTFRDVSVNLCYKHNAAESGYVSISHKDGSFFFRRASSNLRDSFTMVFAQNSSTFH